MNSSSDNELIRKYLKGDAESLEVLIERYVRQIYGFVYKNIGSAADAEDVTQDVFISVWKNLKKFDQKRNFKPWIFQIAKNRSIDFLRKKKAIPFSRFENDKGQNPLIESLVEAPMHLIEKLSDKRTLAAALQNLSGKEQKIVNMRHNDGLNFKEIAEVLNESINTVKSRYRRTLLNLRRYIKTRL